MFKKLLPDSLITANEATTQTDMLDPIVLEGLRDLAGEHHLTIIERFLEFSSGAFTDVEDALTDNNINSVREVAHSLKSSSLQLGATELGNLARDLEAACQEGDMKAAHSIVPQLRLIGEQTMAAFSQYIEAQRTA